MWVRGPMMSRKVTYICKSCSAEVVVDKYSYTAIESGLCRKCKMQQTYKNNPSLVAAAVKARKATCQEKYNCDNVAQDEQIQKKWVATKIGRFGYAGVFKDPKYQKKIQDAAHAPDAMEKKKQTCLDRYGEEHHSKTENFIASRERSYKIRTGYRNPMQNPEVVDKVIATYGRLGAVKNYYFENQYFDSSWELAYYLYLLGSGKQFIYHPKFPLAYEEEGKEHSYFPDFLVEGQFIEIKGSQFFNEKGEPFNKYIGKFWWGKYKALQDYKVKILLHEDLKPILKYVKEKYGKTFLKDCRVRKDSKTVK